MMLRRLQFESGVWRLALGMLLVSSSDVSRADDFVRSPTLGPGPMTNGAANNVQTPFPFLIKQIRWTSMRYQQVYAASCFTNVPANLVYLTTISFFLNAQSNRTYGWSVPSMQINLSTTGKAPDNLSTNFGENVGADDSIVFGSAQHDFLGLGGYDRLLIPLDRPFRYNPASGNLLLDVRILDGTGTFDPNSPWLWAQTLPSDEVATIWASNSIPGSAMSADTTGLFTLFQFSPVPSLTNYTSTAGTSTNFVIIDWPTEPAVFTLQRSPRLGPGANWQPVPNAGSGRAASFQRYYFPASSAGSGGFFRLVGPAP